MAQRARLWWLAMGAISSLSLPLFAQELPVSTLSTLRQQIARFAPTDIGADVSGLPASERQVLVKLIEASKVLDAIFLRQVWAGNEATLLDLVRDETPLGRARLHAFVINKGPWSRLDAAEAFLPGVPARPPGANFYPADASKVEIESWLTSLSAAERTTATGFFTLIRRSAAGALAAVPYSEAYQPELTAMAARLEEAAGLTAEPTLAAYLRARARAFLSNDYFASDIAWMDLDSAIEPVMGPYEVYEDELFNYKAAFQSFITVRDRAETARLQRFGAQLQDIEDHLPIDAKYRNPRLATASPIVVVNELFASGDANRGVQTAAFNLPNDERVLREKGAKRVMLKNVQHAKFDRTLVPISRIVLAPTERRRVTFEAFFTQILVHELMHGLGPHDIIVGGRRSTVRQELKETYSAIEEAKADISSLFAIQHLIDKGVLPRTLETPLYTTYLASAFRSLRFGITEAHGRGMAIQLNVLLDHGAVRAKRDGTFAVDVGRMKVAARCLTGEIMTLQAEGDYQKASAMIASLGGLRPPVRRALDRLRAVPTDIEPRFATASQLLAGESRARAAGKKAPVARKAGRSGR